MNNKIKIGFIVVLLLAYIGYAQSQNLTDTIVSPKEKETTITVGGADADVSGFTNQAIQIAVDALPKVGGIIKLNPGLFKIMAPVRLPSNVKMIGSGSATILKRIDGYHSKFIIDADFGELKVTVEDASGFKKGMSIQITNTTYSECWDVSVAVITAIIGNTLYFDNHLIRDYEWKQNGMVTNAGSCVSVHNAQNVYMSDFVIDGNKDKNDLLDGCNGGGIVIIKSKDVTVENVHVQAFNGEGITWQITENVTIRNSEINGCTNMGLHPGSGSPKSVIEGNNSHHNKVGLFICWRVHNSLVKDNQFHNNTDNGISTGHKDFDVLFKNNKIYDNGKDGVFFRAEDDKNAPHRNTFINNIIENNGRYGFYIDGELKDIIIKDNIIRDTKKGKQKAAIYMTKNTAPVKEENNKMSGHKDGNVIYENQ